MANRITSFVRIRDYRISLNNKPVLSENVSLGLPEFLKHAYQSLKISYPKFHKMDTLSKLGILAVDLLFEGRKIPENTALIFSNSSSSLGTDVIHQKAMDQLVSPAVFVYTLPNIVMGEICIKNKIYGENAFFISEKFDPLLIVQYSESLLNSQAAPAIVCGWIEWKNAEYDVFLCFISPEGELAFSAENLKALYHFENE